MNRVTRVTRVATARTVRTPRPCATVDCQRPARWRSLTECGAFGSRAALRCQQCCEAVDDAFDGLRRAVAAQNRKVTR